MQASGLIQYVVIAILVISTACEPVIGQQGREREQVTWVQGMVRDESGRPVKDAEVFAYATFHGGLRMYEMVRKARTDDAGNYAVRGEANLSSFSAILLGRVPGHPLALAWFRLPEPPGRFGTPSDEKAPAPPTIDLVVPARGGSLEVRVSEHGQPAANVAVVIRLQGINLRDMWARDDSEPERKEVIEFYKPLKRTTADGVARFDGLLPGNYIILASTDNDDAARWLAEDGRNPFIPVKAFGSAHGIPVRVGETTSHHIAVYAQPNVVTFKLTRHDGEPATVRASDGTTMITWGAVGSSGGRTTGIKLDKNGVGQFMFDRVGLTTASFPYQETPITSSPIRRPFWSANSIVAVSPRFPDGFPVELKAVEHRGGTVIAKLFDQDGKLRDGLVKVGNRSFAEISAANGRIEDIDPGTSRVEGRISGVKRIFPDQNMGVLPGNEELVARSEVLPMTVTVGDNEESEVVLRPEKVGYIRGWLRPPPGRKASEYRLSAGIIGYQQGAGVAYRPDVGEFLAGPFRAGTATLQVFRSNRYSMLPLAQREVRVSAGEVAEAEIAVPDSEDGDAVETHAFVGMAGISQFGSSDRPVGKTFLVDGKTPALGAMAAVYHPLVRQLTGAGTADALGTIRPRSFWLSNNPERAEAPGTPSEPVAISWLPGKTGAKVVRLPPGRNDGLEISLPSPFSLVGKVRIAGDGEAIDAGMVTVRAQHEGLGSFDDLLSVETTAGADGRFELAGLTPGKYRVQAVLDGIWLSPSVEFVAGEKALETVTLTIAPPGGPVLVRLIGQRHRQPEKIIVNRPEGPLRERLWPKFLTPDGAGVVRIPALEAGKHSVRVGNMEKVVEVLPLAISKGRPLEIEMKLTE